MLSQLSQGGMRSEDGSVDPSGIAGCCEGLAPLLKQPTFYEEREERLFAWADPESTSLTTSKTEHASQHRIGTAVRDGSRLTQHIELPIISKGPICDDRHIAISRIVLGTRCAADRQDIRTLLREHGFESTVEVIDSDTTYVG